MSGVRSCDRAVVGVVAAVVGGLVGDWLVGWVVVGVRRDFVVRSSGRVLCLPLLSARP